MQAFSDAMQPLMDAESESFEQDPFGMLRACERARAAWDALPPRAKRQVLAYGPRGAKFSFVDLLESSEALAAIEVLREVKRMAAPDDAPEAEKLASAKAISRTLSGIRFQVAEYERKRLSVLETAEKAGWLELPEGPSPGERLAVVDGELRVRASRSFSR